MSKTVARLLSSFAITVTAWQKPLRQSNTLLRVANSLHRRHLVDTAAGPIEFLSTHPQALDYPAGLLTREPETIAWLDEVDETAVLWDVGANVGAYALYAARRGARVWAFEPAPASFAVLSENVRINRLDDRIVALPIALGRTTGLSSLCMTSTNPGSVSHTLGAVGKSGDEFHQAVLSYSVDDFCREFGQAKPTHMKIDVDGIEEDILSGAAETLRAPSFRSLLVEIEQGESASTGRVKNIAAAAGLALMHVSASDGHGHCNAIFARNSGEHA